MTGVQRIASAVEGMPDEGLARVSPWCVVEAAEGVQDETVQSLASGAANVIAEWNEARKENGREPLHRDDPRMDVFQYAGQLRHLLKLAGS